MSWDGSYRESKQVRPKKDFVTLALPVEIVPVHSGLKRCKRVVGIGVGARRRQIFCRVLRVVARKRIFVGVGASLANDSLPEFCLSI
jgi:hypothetical protein